eukprot:348285-Hanusia_phi.AAC.6
MVGGDYVNRNIRLLRTGGRSRGREGGWRAEAGTRHVSIAFQKGSKIEIDLMPVMMKKLELKGTSPAPPAPAPAASLPAIFSSSHPPSGSTMRRRTREEKAEIARSLKENVWPLIGCFSLPSRFFPTAALSSSSPPPLLFVVVLLLSLSSLFFPSLLA